METVENTEPEEHNVKYFRNLLVSETAKLNKWSAHWEQTASQTQGLTEDGIYYKIMSSVCVLDGKYEPRVDGQLENIKQGV